MFTSSRKKITSRKIGTEAVRHASSTMHFGRKHAQYDLIAGHKYLFSFELILKR